MNIAFLEPKHKYDVSADLPASYKQLKSYLLTYSEYRKELSMSYCDAAHEVPDDVQVIGVSGLTQDFAKVIELGVTLRARFPDCLLILGGQHVSYLPETLPTEYDLGVMFEGETTFHEIIDTYISSNGNRESVLGIDGITFHDSNGGTRVNPPNRLVDPLDRIPYPVIEGESAPYLFSSRGCPYTCSFCASTAFWKKVRFLSADYVLAQIEYIQEHMPQKTIVFWDDLVIADRPRFIKIVEGVEARGLNKDTSFGLAVRANLVDEEICELLLRLNTAFVSFGAESGSERILQSLKGKSVSVQMNQSVLDLLSRYGLFTTCSFILGTPTETREDVKQTFDFIRRNLSEGKLYRPIINLLMAMPGTQAWKQGVESGILAPPLDWNRFKFFASYKDSRVPNIDDWIEKRLETRSYYFNEEHLPERELLDMLAGFEHEAAVIEESRGLQTQLERRFNEAGKAHLEAMGAERRKARALQAEIDQRDREIVKRDEQLREREDRISTLQTRVARLAPLVTIVVICWNNRRFLERCFDSLMRTDYLNLEIFLADNASTDGSAAFVAEHYPSVRILVHPENLGFAEGNNRALRLAKGKYVVTLNPDTEVDPSWIQAMVEVAEKDTSVGMISPKMYIMDRGRTLNSAGGDMLLPSGDNLARGFYLEDDGRFDQVEETFGPSAGAGFYRRRMLEDIGLFDRGLFTYFEDVDLNLRAQLRGYRCMYVPDAVVYHYQAGTLNDHDMYKAFLLQRNKWYVVIKNYPLGLMWHFRRDLTRSYLNGMRYLRTAVDPKMPRRVNLSLLKRMPRILALRCAIAVRRSPGATKRIREWVDRHSDTYRELNQAAAVATYMEDLRERDYANIAG